MVTTAPGIAAGVAVRLRVLGLVPARGGSRGVPRKNVRPLAGRPLLQWTTDAALAAASLARVVVSTEDAEVAALAVACGAEVPFARPAALAGDDTPMLAVVRHAVAALERLDDRYDAVCLLQPTCPMRRAADIDACVAALAAGTADAVVTVRRVPHTYHPAWTFARGADGMLTPSLGPGHAPTPRRQDLPAAYHRDGAVYVTRRAALAGPGGLYGARTLGVELPGPPGVNIDDPADWAEAARRLAAPGARPDGDARRLTGAAAR